MYQFNWFLLFHSDIFFITLSLVVVCFTGNAERGWNDPPMFLHTPGVTAPPQGPSPAKRTPLTKRIAHPGLYGANAAQSSQPPLVPGEERSRKDPCFHHC